MRAGKGPNAMEPPGVDLAPGDVNVLNFV